MLGQPSDSVSECQSNSYFVQNNAQINVRTCVNYSAPGYGTVIGNEDDIGRWAATTVEASVGVPPATPGRHGY